MTDKFEAFRGVLESGCIRTGKTHLATAIAIRACRAGHRVLFAIASQWVDRLAEATTTGARRTR